MSAIIALVELGDAHKLAEKLEELSKDKTPCNELSYITDYGHSALSLAALLGRNENVLTLLKYGADVNGTNKSGYTALHYSAAWGKLECLKTLINNGGNYYFLTHSKCTPRDIALRYDQELCVAFLDFLDMRNQLEEVLSKTRQILADNERINGKWTKDDRHKVMGLCSEKSDWLAKNKDSVVEQVQEQKEDFEIKLDPYLIKLQTTCNI